MQAPKQIGFSHGLFVYPPSGPGAGCPILAFFLRKGGRPRTPTRRVPGAPSLRFFCARVGDHDPLVGSSLPCRLALRGLPKITLTQRTIKVSESSMMKQTTAESTTLTVPDRKR